ncbi:MAG: hypothetical protein ACE5IK_12435 [Acidobacteriota bacterium]
MPIGAFEGPASDAIKAALVAEGYKVIRPDGSEVCRVWLRREISGLAQGVLVGLISFPEAWSDFRSQPVAAGSYTLRYARMPSDGNHLGASPTPDFLLLLSLEDDADPATIPDFDRLVALSSKVSGMNHVAPLNLARVGQQSDFPAIGFNEDDLEVLFARIKTPDAELRLALVIAGAAEQ